MANNKYTYQQQTNVSIPRANIIKLAADDKLSKTDYRVLLMLFGSLDGFTVNWGKTHDPENYKKVDTEIIADTLDISEKKVKESMDTLSERGYIEKGSNDTCKNGWRFTF